jgi:hypothetical protein
VGLAWRKVGALPGKADVEEQSRFLSEELEPRLEEARTGERTVWFVDAAHFVYGSFLGYLWCLVRLFVPSPSGRKRYHVLGALNAVTHRMVRVTNQSYINALSVCELLVEFASSAGCPPITVVLDNARYQRCASVQETAEESGIELLFLPRTRRTSTGSSGSESSSRRSPSPVTRSPPMRRSPLPSRDVSIGCTRNTSPR